MNPTHVAFACGFIIGGVCGILIICVVAIAGQCSRAEEEFERKLLSGEIE